MAKNCVISTGRGEACKDSIGGIGAVYFFNYGEAVFTVDTDGYVTAIDNGAGGSVTAYKYVSRHGSNFDQTIQASPENGTTLFDQATNLILKRLDAQTSKEVKLLAWGRPQIVIADNNGKSWLAGRVNGNDISGGTIATGTAKTDLSGYTLNFLGQEREPAYEISGATIDNPFADAAMDVDIVDSAPATIDITTATHAGYISGVNANTVDAILEITVSEGGNYSIETDTVNGYSFSGSGSVGSGTTSIQLIGVGTAGAAGTDTFTISASLGIITGVTSLDVIVT